MKIILQPDPFRHSHLDSKARFQQVDRSMPCLVRGRKKNSREQVLPSAERVYVESKYAEICDSIEHAMMHISTRIKS